MTTLRAQVNLPNVNGLPADVITNTWHFTSLSVDPLDDVATAMVDLGAFYHAVDAFLASTIDPDCFVKWYDLEDAEPRTPIAVEDLVLTLGANAPLPHEVAMVLSYHGTFVSGSSPGRRRGRIFLGPLDSAVMDDTMGQSVIQSGTIAAVATAGGDLVAAGVGSNAKWSVFSPTTAGPPPWTPTEILGATLWTTEGFVDNSFDTIRSRGIAATTRSSF